MFTGILFGQIVRSFFFPLSRLETLWLVLAAGGWEAIGMVAWPLIRRRLKIECRAGFNFKLAYTLLFFSLGGVLAVRYIRLW